jgi:hypothetical protein
MTLQAVVKLLDTANARERLWPYDKFMEMMFVMREYCHAHAHAVAGDVHARVEDPFLGDR